MPWTCPVCGTSVDDELDTCPNCGAARPSTEHLELQQPRQPQPEQPVASEQQGEAEPVQQEAAAETGPAETPQQAPVEPEKPPQNVYLEVINSPAQELIGRKIPLMFSVFTRISLGRSPDNVIVIPDPTVSRRHALISLEGNRVVIQDLGSTNGTFIYNPDTGAFEKIEKAELRDGQIIRLGEQTILRVIIEY